MRALCGADAVRGHGAEPHIGYDEASELVKSAALSGRSLREVVLEQGMDESILDEALDYQAMAKPHG